MTIASLITLLRIVLTVSFGAYYIKGRVLTAFFLFALAGISDIADGYIARRFNCVSNLGKLLDPVADKLLISVGIFVLVYTGTLNLSWLASVLLLEVAFVVGAICFLARGIVVHSGKYGKAASVFFTGAIGCGILGMDMLCVTILGCALMLGLCSLGYYALYFTN